MQQEKELILPVVGIDKEASREALVDSLLKRAEAGERFNVSVSVAREPDNPFDPYALAAYLDGQKVGYVPRSWHGVLKLKMPQIFTEPVLPASIFAWGRSSAGQIFLEVKVYASN